MPRPRPVATDRAPAAIGPYSQAVVGGDTVYCSGQIALDPRSGELVGDDAASQARQCLENLGAVLEAAGSGFDRVVRCNVFLIDMADYPAVNEVYAEVFGGDVSPSRACVQVTGLPKAALVEIDCVALV